MKYCDRAMWASNYRLGQDLDGHLALQTGVVGAIHLAHAVCAQRFDNLEVSESGTCLHNGLRGLADRKGYQRSDVFQTPG